MKLIALLPFCLVLVTPVMAAANTQPTLKAKHGDWAVYTRGSGADTVCYALSEAQTKAPTNVNHGDVYFIVSNWKNGAATEQPSFLAGYGLKTTRAPKARVGSTSLTMYAADQEAFIEATSDERALVSKMRAGATMDVSAVSQRGTQTNYQFSLKGVTAALRDAKAACT